MVEINKLRQRLQNIGRNTTEYRMTVVEARALISEFEELESALAKKNEYVPVITELPPAVVVRTLDGGTF